MSRRRMPRNAPCRNTPSVKRELQKLAGRDDVQQHKARTVLGQARRRQGR
jgi:hypothetical protein